MRASPRSIPSSIARGATVTVLAVALATGLAACKRGGADGKPGDDKAKSEQAEAVAVEVARVGNRTMVASYTGTAALTPRAEAEVAAKASGIALRVLAQEGQTVRAGQPLVQLDRDRARLQVAQAQSQVGKLEANYRRASQLAAQKMVSANDVDQLRYDLANARSALNMARLELQYGTVTAPISGQVVFVAVKPGNFVQINSTVMKLMDNSRLEATLNVPERDIALLRKGQKVLMDVDAVPGERFEGVIDRIAPMVDAGSGTFRVFCAFNGNGVLQPGMFGRMAITYDERADVPSIPRVALLDDGSDPAVYVVRAGKAMRVPVKLGYADGEFVEVREGLKLGEQVVTAGKTALREGSSVQVIDPATPPTAAPAPVAAAKK